MTTNTPNEAVILGAVRTPFGRRGGALRNTRPDELLATALEGVLERSGVPGEQIGDVLAGCVSQAGEQAPTSAGRPCCWQACRPRCRRCR